MLPSSTEVKNGGTIPPLPHTPSWHGAYLIELLKPGDYYMYHINTGTCSSSLGVGRRADDLAL
jgi:hypothetical protein